MTNYLTPLPADMKSNIVYFLDIPDLLSLRSTDKNLRDIIDNLKEVWKRLACQIGSAKPLIDIAENWKECARSEVIWVRKVAKRTMKSNWEVKTLIREKSLGIKDIIRLKFLLVKQKFENLRKLYSDVPRFIEELLSKEFPKIEDVNELNNWLKARDTLMFWNCLRSVARLPLIDHQFECLSNCSEYMNVIPMFKVWFQENITKLKEVKSLELYKKLISFLPEELWQLTSLRFLSLGCNQIVYISEDIAKLTSLERLFIYDNQLIDVPDKITGIKTLIECNLLNNKLPECLDFRQKLKENGVHLFIKGMSYD